MSFVYLSAGQEGSKEKRALFEEPISIDIIRFLVSIIDDPVSIIILDRFGRIVHSSNFYSFIITFFLHIVREPRFNYHEDQTTMP